MVPLVVATPAPSAMRSRSIRLKTGVTSIRLENVFWAVLVDIAASEALSLSQLVAKLCPDCDRRADAAVNKASALRIACLHYALASSAHGPREPPSAWDRLAGNPAGPERAARAASDIS